MACRHLAAALLMTVLWVPWVSAAPLTDFVNPYCVRCHDEDTQEGGLDLDKLARDPVDQHPEIWERVVRKLRARQMPPVGKKRPTNAGYDKIVQTLAGALDQNAMVHPNPGRGETFRRLNRIEYQNSVRDLLALDIDASALLPKDDASHGFDNVTVGDLSPTLLNRYLSAAKKISRLAIGTPQRTPNGDTFRLPADLTQEDHSEGLPVGTRGGTLLSHTFPRDGSYDIQIRLSRNRDEVVEGLHETHDLELLVDGDRVKLFSVAPPADGTSFEKVDGHLTVRVPVAAGPHKIGVTFLKTSSSLVETRRQPYSARYNMHRHPRLSPAIYQISINGPYDARGPGDTPSRRRILGDIPVNSANEDESAARLLSSLIRRAYRRPVTSLDLEKPMEFYRQAKKDGGFELGMEAALNAVLINPEFLFRIERDPIGVAPGAVYPVSDLALAARLSFFLWSSMPDDELLATAERGELHMPQILDKQVRRMLADPRAGNLSRNFAAQWLYLRNLESFTPDLRLYPDFDDNLRQAFRRETELHFETMVRDDRSVLELIKTNTTFVNERLAKHYGIPHVYGSHFRRVTLDKDSVRGGLLRQGSILTVTSYATRTSPVIRGHWILGNLLGTPPPPPPPDVPTLKENTVSASLPMRERLAQHRAQAACAGCHNLMDPVGFSLENFDALGHFRTMEDGLPLDVTGGFADGSTFSGVAGLEQALYRRPELFVSTLAEKVLTFALGRGVESYDAPAIRKIVRAAKAQNYRFSSLVLGIVHSVPFSQRRAP